MSTQLKASDIRGVCGMAVVSLPNNSYDGEATELSMILSNPSVMRGILSPRMSMQDRMMLPLVFSNEASFHEAVD